MTEITKQTFDKKVEEFKRSAPAYNGIENLASSAKSQYIDANATKVGKVAGQVTGGIESVTSKLQGGDLNLSPTEGVLTDGIEVDGLVNNAVETGLSALTSKFGAKVTFTYSEPDSNGAVFIEEIDNETLDGTISSIIGLITGLGIGPGFAQNVVANASPAGLISATGKLKDKVGAFSGAAAVAALTDTAKSLAADISASVMPTLRPGDSSSFQSFVTDINNASNDVSNVITSGAVADSLKLAGTVAAIAGGDRDGKDVISGALALFGTLSALGGQQLSFKEEVKQQSTTAGVGIVQGLMQKETQDENVKLQEIAPTLTEEERQEAIVKSQGSPAEQAEAVELVAKKSELPAQEVKKILASFDTTIAGKVVIDTFNSAFKNPFEIGTDVNNWSFLKEDSFTYISSAEELEADMKQSKREITEMVVHWTETYSNKNIGAVELNDMHKKLGMEGIAYHYVIRRDGSLQRGRPLKVEGEHADINGHNKYSIGVAFVGGYNCPSGTPNPEDYLSAASLTRAQMNTFEQVCNAFYLAYPGGQIVGHNDLDATENDPGFDVIDYCLDVFGKESLFEDTFFQAPFTPAELNKKRLP